MIRRLRWVVPALPLLLVPLAGSGPEPARAVLSPHLGYGINVRDQSRINSLVDHLGLDWVKLWEEYGPLPSERLPYQVLYLVDCGEYADDADLTAWGDHVEALAADGLGLVEAYEICNEPNLSRFWLGQPPDPVRYAEMLCVAYERVKSIDPDAAVVSGGLAPVGRIQGNCGGWDGNDCGAMDERAYAQAMVSLAGGSCLDAFGYHPYGFAYAPEQDPEQVSNGFAFRGAEVMRDILLSRGLDHVPVWATEFNWLRDSASDGELPGYCVDYYETWFGWMEVTEQQQADYLVGAFQYADDNWPWMHAMFVWNLDWQDYHTWGCEAARYFSIRRHDGTITGTLTQAYTALQTMDKRPGPFAPRLRAYPGNLLLLADVDEPGLIESGVVVRNVGYRTLGWTATSDPAEGLTVTLPISISLISPRPRAPMIIRSICLSFA